MSITNIETVPIIDAADLSDEERKEFDWIDSSETLTWDDADFFRYRGEVYCLSDFEATSVPDWDGQHTDTFFSAILVKYALDDDGDDAVKAGMFYAD